jgi:hypothetical protein
MRQRRNGGSPCGSGSRFERCGADAARHAALVDVRNAAIVPALRPSGAAVLGYCRRVAGELGENEGNVPGDVIAGGVALVDEGDRAHIVSIFREAAPRVMEQLSIVADHAERELVGSTVIGAICDRRPMPRTRLVVIETSENLPEEVGVRLGAATRAS